MGEKKKSQSSASRRTRAVDTPAAGNPTTEHPSSFLLLFPFPAPPAPAPAPAPAVDLCDDFLSSLLQKTLSSYVHSSVDSRHGLGRIRPFFLIESTHRLLWQNTKCPCLAQRWARDVMVSTRRKQNKKGKRKVSAQ